MGCKFCFAILTHWRRLCLEQSTGLLPLTISSRSTPNANTSVFSSTTPCIKYSGAKYLIQIQIWFNFYQEQYSNNHRLHLSKCSKFISHPCFNNRILKCFFFKQWTLNMFCYYWYFYLPESAFNWKYRVVTPLLGKPFCQSKIWNLHSEKKVFS